MATAARDNILIIDDSSFERQLLREVLGQANYIVHTAGDGRQGYELAAGLRPKLILLDLRMPQPDGLATCRLLKANRHTADIPIIFLSATDSVDDRIEALQAGAVDFVTKPYVARELLARIEIHLRLAPRAEAETAAVHGSPHPDEVLVQAACRLIDGDLAAVPKLEVIADRVGSYREKLSRVFRERLGVTVFEYIRERRLAMATQLLADTEMPVADIADLIGFQSAANFSTAFREHTGATPRAFRRQRSAAARPGLGATSLMLERAPAAPRDGTATAMPPQPPAKPRDRGF